MRWPSGLYGRLAVYALLQEKGKAEELAAKIGLNGEELANWRIIADKMRLRRINELVLLQFDGFLQQKALTRCLPP